MKKIIFFTVLIISFFIINNLIHSIYDLWQKKDLIAKAELELIHQKQENKKLRSELSYAESREFIEKEARDKLLLLKPNEQQVLIPQDLNQKREIESKDNTANWKKWWDLFF